VSKNWRERWLDSTRGRIISLLRLRSRTVNELAEALELTDNAVRAHLAALERDGLVVAAGLQKATRKPMQAYALSAQAEDMFPKSYAPILGHLLEVLVDKHGTRSTRHALREVARRMAAEHIPRLEMLTPPARARAVLAIVEALGGLAELREADGEVWIEGCRCPLADVVPQHPDICCLAETLISELLGRPVREHCERDGASVRCRFAVVD
jgi:predicted ArsR family transcriptional regulator